MRIVFAFLLLGCRAAAPPPPVRHGAMATTRNADALAYEHGSGVPRDFRIAAGIYGDACAAGCGDLHACHALLELAIAGRGITPSLGDLPTAARMCHRGDTTACVVLDILGLAVEDPTVAKCSEGNPLACERDMWLDVRIDFSAEENGPPPPPTGEQLAARLRHEMTGPAAQLCGAGVLDGCIHVVAACHDQICIDERVAVMRASNVDPAPLVAAWSAVDRGCHAGDVDACASAGRAISADELCRAGASDACGHDRGAAIKQLQKQIGELTLQCHAHDAGACGRLSALAAATCR